MFRVGNRVGDQIRNWVSILTTSGPNCFVLISYLAYQLSFLRWTKSQVVHICYLPGALCAIKLPVMFSISCDIFNAF